MRKTAWKSAWGVVAACLTFIGAVDVAEDLGSSLTRLLFRDLKVLTSCFSISFVVGFQEVNHPFSGGKETWSGRLANDRSRHSPMDFCHCGFVHLHAPQMVAEDASADANSPKVPGPSPSGGNGRPSGPRRDRQAGRCHNAPGTSDSGRGPRIVADTFRNFPVSNQRRLSRFDPRRLLDRQDLSNASQITRRVPTHPRSCTTISLSGMTSEPVRRGRPESKGRGGVFQCKGD